MLGEILVRFDGVRRNADNFSAGGGIVFPTIPHRAHLLSTDWRFVAGIKEQDYHFAAMIRESPLHTFAVKQLKVRRGHAFLYLPKGIHVTSQTRSNSQQQIESEPRLRFRGW